MKNQTLKYAVALFLTAGLLYLAFRGQNLANAWASILQAKPIPLIGGLLIMWCSHALRAVRWNIILRPLKRRTSFWNSFKAVAAGYGMNNLIPRSGELVRPYLMSKEEGLPMAGVFASVVIERLADVVALVVLIAFSLSTFRASLTNAFPMLGGWVVPTLVGMLVLLVIFVATLFSEARTVSLLSFLTKPLSLLHSQKIIQVGRDFSKGLQGLDRNSWIPLLFGSAGIWILYGLSMYVSLMAFDDPAMERVGISGSFLLLTLSGISFTIPTPGGSGTYHMFISRGLMLVFGVAASTALAFAVVTHALSFISTTIIGVVITLRAGVSLKSLGDKKSSDTSSAIILAAK